MSKHKTCPECNGTGLDEVDPQMLCWNCLGEGVVELAESTKEPQDVR